MFTACPSREYLNPIHPINVQKKVIPPKIEIKKAFAAAWLAAYSPYPANTDTHNEMVIIKIFGFILTSVFWWGD